MPVWERNRIGDGSLYSSEENGVLKTIVAVFQLIRHRWKVPCWFLLTFWLAGVLYYTLAPRQYRSVAELLIQKVGRDELLVGSEQVLEEVVQKLTSTESEIFSGVSPEKKVVFIREKISMNHPGGRPSVLQLSYPHKDPRIAQIILSTIVEKFKKFADDEKLRRSIDPKAVQKNEFAKRLLAELQQKKAQLDSKFAASRIDLFLSYKKLQKEVSPKIIPTSGLDQLPKPILNTTKNFEPLKLASDPDEKMVQVNSRDPKLQKKLIDLKYLNYETKMVGQVTEMIADLISLTTQELDTQGEIVILAKASYPVIPESPFSLKMLGILTTVCGLIFGFGFVFLTDRLDDRFRSSGEIEKFLQIPFLGAISFPFSRNKQKTENSQSIKPQEDVQNAAALIRSHRRKFRSFVITSPNPTDQNPMTALQLSQALANQGEKILLIDADARSSELSQLCGQAGRTGLCELLDSEIAMDDGTWSGEAILLVRKNLSILPSGNFSDDFISRFSHSRAKRLMTLFEKEYDRIILFAPNLSTAADAAVLARNVDGCLLCFEPTAKRSAVFEALRTLKKFGILKVFGMTVRSQRMGISILPSRLTNGPKLHLAKNHSEDRQAA